jgi:hypothetical protein
MFVSASMLNSIAVSEAAWQYPETFHVIARSSPSTNAR